MESTLENNKKPDDSDERLGDFIRRKRIERKLSVVQFAEATKLSKQYISDLEHNRRGRKIDGLTASKIAAALDVPVSTLTDKVRKVTDKEARHYEAYQRVLRSTERARQAFGQIAEQRRLAAELRIALRLGTTAQKDSLKLLQQLENTTESLARTLSYKREPAKRWARVEGEDAKFKPGRPASNVR